MHNQLFGLKKKTVNVYMCTAKCYICATMRAYSDLILKDKTGLVHYITQNAP